MHNLEEMTRCCDVTTEPFVQTGGLLGGGDLSGKMRRKSSCLEEVPPKQRKKLSVC